VDPKNGNLDVFWVSLSLYFKIFKVMDEHTTCMEDMSKGVNQLWLDEGCIGIDIMSCTLE